MTQLGGSTRLAAIGLCVALASAGACTQVRETPRPESPALRGGDASTGADQPGGADGGTTTAGTERVERRSIGAVQQVELPTTVLAVEGEQSALLVSPEPLRNLTHLRRVDRQGRLGPVRSLVGRQVVGGYDTAAQALLLTSDGKRLCVEPLDGAERAPHCRPSAAQLAVVLDDRLALIEERPDDEGKEEQATARAGRGSSEGAATRPPRKGKRPHQASPSPKPPKKQARTSRKRGKTKRSSQAPKAIKPVKMRLWLKTLAPPSGASTEPIDTGLTFLQPLPGMGLVDGLGVGKQAQLLYYEHNKSRREGRKRIAQARLRTARLGPDGKLVPGSRATLFEGDRRYGYVDGHLSPRLFGRAGRAVFLGRFVDAKATPVTRGWEAKVLRPWAGITTGPPIPGVDPARLALPTAVTPQEQTAYDKLAAVTPRLVGHQSTAEAGRVAWAGTQGFAIVGGRLSRVDRTTGAPRDMAPPFVARRGRLYWGAITPAGAGLALTSDGLVELLGDGTTRRHALTAEPSLQRPLGRAAQIGDSWWILRASPAAGAEGVVTRLLPSRQDAAAVNALVYRESTRLVGGASQGLLLSLRGDQLSVWRLDAGGGTQALATYRSPIGGGFAAVRRAAGGALVAGPSRTVPARTLVFAVDDRGQLLPTHVSAVAVAHGNLRLVPLPGGGAWLTRRGGARVAWLDDDGREVRTAGWPRKDSGAPCLDGRPSRAEIPAVTPGAWLRLPAMAGPGSCAVSEPTWADDGSLRWFGSTTAGLDSRAELVIVRPPAPGSPAATPGAPPALGTTTTAPAGQPASGARPPCPPDMVHLPANAGAQPRAELCVDRYEAHVVDGATGVPLSPYYPTTPKLTGHVLSVWAAGHRRTGNLHARAMPLPPLLRAAAAAPKVVARSRVSVVPSGYLTSFAAEKACLAAGKRLCTLDEWRRACRGEQNRDFPYGDDYEHGACNVYRYAHPAATLHGNAAVGHLDPRLNRVTEAGAPMLRRTGATGRCASRWGDDAIYDMVGNLDEWVDEKGGAFAGAFYSRSSRSGCAAAISVHPRRYLDYSLGTRCCLSPKR